MIKLMEMCSDLLEIAIAQVALRQNLLDLIFLAMTKSMYLLHSI